MTYRQTVLVTGGSGKLGRGIVGALLTDGARVIVPTRSIDSAGSLWQGASDQDLLLFETDLAEENGLLRLLDWMRRNSIEVSRVVHSARSLHSLTVEPDGVTAPEMFKAELDLQVVLPYRLTMALALSVEHALESVVFLGSQYGLVAPNPALYQGRLDSSPIQYGVAKGALHHLTRELAVRLAARVRVNAVAFGGFEGRTDEGFRLRYAALSPNGRMLRDEEAVGPVLFLLGEGSSSITGHVLVADGGWSIW